MQSTLWLALCLLLGALSAGPVLSATAPGGAVSAPAQHVQVQEGDMASVLAFRLKPRGATIEQMMVALLRHNPDAFLLGNVNLLRDGALLRLPVAEDVLRTSPDEARDLVLRHHQAFLNNPDTAVEPAPQASAAPTGQPDPAAERAALLERLRTAKTHLNELQQNIQELERLTQETPDPQPPTTTTEAAPADAAIPNSWLWLGVAAIVAVMVGVGAAGRPKRQAHKPDTSGADAASAFQARLGALDLNLDTPSTSSASGPPQ